MKNKIICILVCMLMTISTMITILYTNNIKVEASNGGEGGNNRIGLDYNFMWNITNNLSKVVYNAYSGNDIRKGRSFGTKGEQYTADYFYNEIMTSKLQLKNVQELPIGPIKIDGVPYKDQPYKDWYYTNKVDVDDYDLTLNFPGYPYADAPNGHLPKNETFPFPSGCKNKYPGIPRSVSYTHSFDDIRLRSMDINSSWDLFGGLFTGQWYNVNDCIGVNCQPYIFGNATYVEDVGSLPEDQEGRVFLMDEKPGCQYILENVTNASTVILMQNESKYSVNQDTIDNCSYQIARVSSNETNLSTVIDELKNGTFMVADNYYDNEMVTFTYGFDNHVPEWWPEYDFFILVWCNETNITTLLNRTLAMFVYNSLVYHPLITNYGWCHGFIFYDSSENTHYMNLATRNWIGFGTDSQSQFWGRLYNVPGLQMFSVNHSVGKWLNENWNNPDDTVSGFIKQTFFEEKHPPVGEWTSELTAYNVEGSITSDNNPSNAIVICSDRFDSWWGECPGDSGAGAGMVLAIAKYMIDNNINPKYDITFLEDTGEEYGFRGAWHYNHSHPVGDFNIIRWIGFDQLGFKQETGTFKLIARCNDNDTDGRILNAIASDIDLGIEFVPEEAIPGGGISEDVAWLTRLNCKTILFAKDGPWLLHHHTGKNFVEGDSMKNMDCAELNATLNLSWAVMKYYTVNPDCRFNYIDYTIVDSPNDGDTLPDSIQADFNISSILPCDTVMVNASLRNQNNEVVTWSIENYSIVTMGLTDQKFITLTLPPNVEQGYYTLQLRLYNSTGRINKTLGFDDTPNETLNSGDFYLYHPFGNPTPGHSFTNTEDAICGSYFTTNEYGIAQNITAYLQTNTTGIAVHSTCMIYRNNDSKLIGRTQEIEVATGQTPRWVVYNFSTSDIIFEKNTEYVLVCWSDSSCNLYYDSSAPTMRGRRQLLTYGPLPDPAQWDFFDTKLYSIYCSYENDSTPPSITNVTATPYIIGLGSNVTISANITDNQSGVNTVEVHINPPSELSQATNHTMVQVNNHSYQYVFNDTWLTGQYNYTIWATDFSNNTASSTGNHFHVSANAIISIATLKDSYRGTEYINITDPPNPPENLTVTGRGLTWNTYYNASSGENILETYQGPVNYQEVNGTWMPINNTLSQLSSNHSAYAYGYRIGNDHGLYGVYFKPDLQSDWPIAFTYNRTDDTTTSVIRSKLVGVGYVDPQSNWAYQYLQNVQNSQGQITDNAMTYPGAFTGTDVTWSYGNIGMKEEITLSNTTKTVLQNHPPSQYGLNNSSSYLVFITKLDYQNLDLYNGSGLLDGNITITDTGVEFKDVLGQFKCALPLGEAYELNNESVREKLTYRIVHLNGNTYLLSGLKVADLNAMTFPVVIDPTLTVYSISSDGNIYNSGGNYNTIQTASSGSVNSTRTYISIGQWKTGLPVTYSIYRGFVFFNTSALPSNAYLDNATLSLYKKDDYSSTDFDITIQNGQPIYPHTPMQSSDYNKNDYSGNGGTLNTSSFTSGYNAIELKELSWINETGITKLCLRSNKDINKIAPTGSEYVNVYSNEFSGMLPPKLVINYRNQSKINNIGSTDIRGYLLIQVQFYNTSQGEWQLDDGFLNETSPRIINSSSQFGLDTVFNGNIRASDLQHGTGTYCIFVALRDLQGNVLRTDGGRELSAWWLFSKT